MAITTLLAAFVALQWGYSPLAVVAVNGFFLVIDLLFFSANVTKFFEGGWFPLLLAVGIALLMLTWRTGQRQVEKARILLRQAEKVFVRRLLEAPPVRLPGTAIILTSASSGIPLVLTHHLKHNRVLHERVLLVTVRTTEEPRVAEADRIEVAHVADGISRVVLRYGFMESPDVPEAFALPSARASWPASTWTTSPITSGARRSSRPQSAGDGAVARGDLRHSEPQCRALSGLLLCPRGQVVEIGIEIEI